VKLLYVVDRLSSGTTPAQCDSRVVQQFPGFPFEVRGHRKTKLRLCTLISCRILLFILKVGVQIVEHVVKGKSDPDAATILG